jgi:hypothetical protein
MSTAPAVTMQDLEFEHAELLPGRETLWFGTTITKGLQLSALNGNNVASGNSVAVQGAFFGHNSAYQYSSAVGGGNQNIGGLQITG